MMLTIGELANRSNITVRTLRYYESKGLLSPARSEAGQRLYAYPDIMRLQQVQLLKRAGFTLAQIKAMLGSATIEARQVLGVQKQLLTKQLADTKASLAAIDDTLKQLDGNETDLFTLCNMIKMGESAMSTEKWQKVWDKFYTPEENARWAAAKEAVPEDIQRAHEAAWPDILARTEKLVGTDPASEEAQALLLEWNAMTQVIYDIDPTLTRAAAKLYDNMDEWPEDGPEKPFSPEVWDFIQKAQKVADKKSATG
jgi:DNA-binding transcriptional MerR regulator